MVSSERWWSERQTVVRHNVTMNVEKKKMQLLNLRWTTTGMRSVGNPESTGRVGGGHGYFWLVSWGGDCWLWSGFAYWASRRGRDHLLWDWGLDYHKNIKKGFYLPWTGMALFWLSLLGEWATAHPSPAIGLTWGITSLKRLFSMKKTITTVFFTYPLSPNLSSLRTQLSTGQLTEGMAILYEQGCRLLGATTFWRCWRVVDPSLSCCSSLVRGWTLTKRENN